MAWCLLKDIILKLFLKGAGEIIQFIKCLWKSLPHKNGDWGSIPRTYIKNLYAVVHAWNASAVEAEIGGSSGLLASQSRLLDQFQANERPSLKKNKMEGF